MFWIFNLCGSTDSHRDPSCVESRVAIQFFFYLVILRFYFLDAKLFQFSNMTKLQGEKVMIKACKRLHLRQKGVKGYK